MEIFNWLITSSANPENVSLFIKSAVVLGALFGLDSTVISQAGNEVVHLIALLGMVVSSVTALVGLIRKLQLGRWSHPQ